ncbi:DUF924 family protein [Roseobacter sp. N2S]|uniref:DUF924 family protein n=1 Tax=Roseobacter sp. N2S TaxID=2663844 RepID=UPI002866CFAD|nr:DUF924 family protein [Roseobacter sp. N2S]MDR6265530.1 uncharacterized protein (DUF924 family) [Roseobacter sp. N2S]
MDKAQTIIKFWIDEVGPAGWYQGTEELDQKIRDRFMEDWDAAKAGQYDSWGACPEKCLALLILLDQFPRNMFREDPNAFATDDKARKVASHAIDEGYDLRTDEPQRQFFYLPFMHSECLTHQERCVRFMAKRMTAKGSTNLLHAKVHRAVIRKFGRFPYRNNALGRHSTPAEVEFLEDGGYQRMTKDVQKAA